MVYRKIEKASKKYVCIAIVLMSYFNLYKNLHHMVNHRLIYQTNKKIVPLMDSIYWLGQLWFTDKSKIKNMFLKSCLFKASVPLSSPDIVSPSY